MADGGPAGSALVEGRAIGVRLGDRAVLTGVDIAVHEGEIVTLVGPNGAGKTTLVRVLLGLVRPDQGAVRRRSVAVGYVPQHLAIDATLPLTVRRFLMLAGAAGDAIQATASEVDIADSLATPLTQASGGELRRAMLARALLRSPRLLVLDEPTQGVDVIGQARFYDLVRTIRDRRRCGVLMVSHDLNLVMAATDHVICLNAHVCCAGHPESVSRDPAYVALFGPRLATSFAVYHHDHDHEHAPDGHVVRPPGAEPAPKGDGDAGEVAGHG